MRLEVGSWVKKASCKAEVTNTSGMVSHTCQPMTCLVYLFWKTHR